MKDNYVSKIIYILCLSMLFLLSACQPFSEEARFDTFLDRCLQVYAREDVFSLHTYLGQPDKYAIKVEDCQLPLPYNKSILEEKKKLLEELHSYEMESLPQEKQDLAQLLEKDLTLTLEGADRFPYYASTLGRQGQAITLINSLYLYQFHDKEDVENYFSILEKVPDYLQALITYEEGREASGLPENQTLLTDTIASLDSILKQEGPDHFLVTSFRDRLQNLNLDQKAYYEKNLALLSEILLPAYASYRERLSEFLTTSQDSAIFQVKNGSEYYDYLIHRSIDSTYSAEKCKEILEKMYQDSLLRLQTLEEKNEDLYLTYYSASPAYEGVREIVDHLRKNTFIDFKSLEPIDYEIIDYPEELASLSTIAHYVEAGYESQEKDRIFINPYYKKSSELYGILAHETYPGHMYQTHTLYQSMSHPLILFLRNDAYEEGWGFMAELHSYQFMNFNGIEGDDLDDLRALYKENSLMSLCICSLADLYVNKEGHSAQETTDWLAGYGISAENADSIYHHVIGQPTSYLAYTIGYYSLQMNQYGQE